MSPFRALYGRDPRLPPDPQVVKIHTNHMDATSWWLYLQSNIPLLRRALQYNLNKAQQRQKKHFDATHKPGELEIGNQVRVYYPIHRKGLCESFMHRWLGPYQVTHRIRANTYRLRRMDTSSQTVAHISRIKKILGSSMATVPPVVGNDTT